MKLRDSLGNCVITGLHELVNFYYELCGELLSSIINYASVHDSSLRRGFINRAFELSVTGPRHVSRRCVGQCARKRGNNSQAATPPSTSVASQRLSPITGLVWAASLVREEPRVPLPSKDRVSQLC
ncbi:hypothetical protein E2C01_051058 [Portunus trituberculatus]|uniref:Uncharacterized protein n=1 Tax=Portunus trituberculatus TaxID=210409 RepID=A0A5B7GI54_PORTR|nr:hypothetical protein [Portunus trituberculatus]